MQSIRVSSQASAKFLLWIALGLTIAHVICMLGWYRGLFPVQDYLYISFFDLDEEESLGTWFSALILFLAGVLSLFHGRYCLGSRNRWHFCWWLLGIGFCLLSLDEVAGFHEFVNTVVEDTHWTTYGVMLVLVTGVALLPFILLLPSTTRLLFLLAGVIYVGGAIGVEWGTMWYEENDQLNTLGYNLWNALEEFLEMAGVILYLYALLALIEDNRKGTGIQLEFGRGGFG